MKKICLLFFIVAASCTAAQKKDHIISLHGLGSLNLGMSQEEAEKVVNEKIILPNSLDTINSIYQDTAKLKYKNIDIQLEFDRSYYAPNVFRMRLIGIKANSPLCKTEAGIGVGTDILKIIAAFDSLHVKIQPGYVNYYETEQGKGKSTVSILDDAASTMDYFSDAYTMVFYLLNKKVVSFELTAKLKDERD
ncbi:MAG: hypothetical protein ABIP79_06055 [Chitinophagaceae bacterium]